MPRLRAEDRAFVAVVAVTAVGYLLASSPLVGTDNAGWARHIVADTPRQIWASSHFGQVLNYLVLERLAWLDPAMTAFTAMRLVSYGMGLLYVAALALLATTSPRRGRIAFFIIGALSPLTVFLHGEEEIPYYPFPVLLLVAALWRRAGRAPGAGRGGALSALGGLAAAFHGVGLFFLPGIAALGWGAGSARRSARERLRATLDSMVMFFGPIGALFVFYVLAFPAVTIFPGDAGGGGQRTLFVPLFGTIPAFHEFRAYSFFSLTHLQDVALLVVMGAPALLVLAAWAVARGRSVAAQLRADGPLWVLAGCGLVFVTFFYAGVSVLVTQSMLVPALSLAQVLAALTLVSADSAPWRRSFPALLLVTVAATAFDWAHAGTNATTF